MSDTPYNGHGESDLESFNWYCLVASDQETLERLNKPKYSEDYLLRMIADPLLDQTRLYRVSKQRMLLQGCKNLLDIKMPYYSDFDRYLSQISSVDRMIAEGVPAAYVLAPSVDAMCAKTNSGRVIVVSEALRYFLYFMTIANYHLISSDNSSIPTDVSGSAILIAVRTMRLNEALDFDMDPRGEVPPSITNLVEEVVGRQMSFIIGHEYAHHALGHTGYAFPKAINGTNLIWEIYQRSWSEEFEADLASISAVESKDDRRIVVHGGILALLFIFFYETVISEVDPAFAEIKTHPPTCERLLRIVEEYGDSVGVTRQWADEALEEQRALALQLYTRFQHEPNLLNFYGSVYLGSWRGPVLTDRIDY